MRWLCTGRPWPCEGTTVKAGARGQLQRGTVGVMNLGGLDEGAVRAKAEAKPNGKAESRGPLQRAPTRVVSQGGPNEDGCSRESRGEEQGRDARLGFGGVHQEL
jgi:hypothetical protein